MEEKDLEGWEVVEWEWELKKKEEGEREGDEFVRENIIRVNEKELDDLE